MSAPTPKLFQPMKLGRLTLGHRVVLAPCSRHRVNTRHVPSYLTTEYYAQRASTPGTLLVTEATIIAPQAGGASYVPGAFLDEQLLAWSRVTDAVHQRGSFIYLQLWAHGRAAEEDVLKSEDPNYDVVSASDIAIQDCVVPRPLTREEIDQYVEWYATAASNAVYKAGFDGVEIHNASGYLLDQFLQDVSNKRTDEYGCTIENRCRFTLRVIEAISKAIGQDRVGIRFSPWSRFHEMRMDNASIQKTFSYLVTSIRDTFPDMAYIHLVEPSTMYGQGAPAPGESNEFIREIWQPRPLITCGDYSRESALKTSERTGELIAFGRHFIANPDLPKRLRENLPFNHYDRSTFYTKGEASWRGYVDYPFYNPGGEQQIQVNL